MRYPGFLLALLPLLTGIGPATAQPAPPRRALSGEELSRRRDFLRRALKTDADLQAADELALLGPADKATWTALIQAMGPKGRKPHLAPQHVNALAAAGPPAVPDILRAMAAIRLPASGDPFFSEEGQSYLALVAALGRMGPPAGAAAPALRKALTDPKLDPQFKAALRVALANLGDHSRANLGAILRDLKGEAGEANIASVLLMMDSAGPGPWVGPEVLAELRKLLGRAGEVGYRGAALVARVLGLMGERAAGAAGELDKVRRGAADAGDVFAPVFGLALARTDPKRGEAVVRRVCKALRVESAGGIAVLVLEVRPLVDAHMSERLVALLTDRDAEVAEGAAALLYTSGLAAQGAFDPLLAFVCGKAEEARRASAARALATVTPFSELPRLEEALKSERSEKVRQALRLAIRDVKFLGAGSD